MRRRGGGGEIRRGGGKMKTVIMRWGCSGRRQTEKEEEGQ